MIQKNVYEIGFLINPDLSQQEAGQTIENLKNILGNHGASVISEGEVVDIDLAYQIITKIASKNERFNKAYFSWIKFDSETLTLEKIKKEVEKIKSEVFRFLITKTIAEDKDTDKYMPTSSGSVDNENSNDTPEETVIEDSLIDTTSEKFEEQNKQEKEEEKTTPEITEEKKKEGFLSKILKK